jgi:hypothetical protein
MGASAGLILLVSILIGYYSARMWDDEALNTFQVSLPVMPRGTIPVNGGIDLLRNADPKKLANPWPISPAVIERGRISYGFYCIHCHGSGFDGITVGQLLSRRPISWAKVGPNDRLCRSAWAIKEPPLYDTVAARDRWAVINYLRPWLQGSERQKRALENRKHSSEFETIASEKIQSNIMFKTLRQSYFNLFRIGTRGLRISFYRNYDLDSWPF